MFLSLVLLLLLLLLLAIPLYIENFYIRTFVAYDLFRLIENFHFIQFSKKKKEERKSHLKRDYSQDAQSSESKIKLAVKCIFDMNVDIQVFPLNNIFRPLRLILKRCQNERSQDR